jgi:hypothetical protein
MTIACVSVLRGKRERELLHPLVEERLDLLGAQLVTELLEAVRVLAGEKPVVQGLEGNALFMELLLDPLVTVEADPDRERDTGADLDEGRAEILILEIEVVVLDEHRLTGIVEAEESRVGVLVCLESMSLLLSHTDKDHPLRLIKLLAILGSDIVFALPPLKVDYGDTVLGGERLDGSDESLGHTPQECRRGHLLASVIPQEADQLPRRLQPGYVGIQVDAVQALHLKGYMLAEKLVDVGHDGPPFGGILPRPTITSKACS